MKYADFKKSVDSDAPPDGLGLALQALWQDAKGDWDAAHKLAQAQKGEDGAWVHAYLHRVEGDDANAGYWYKRAARPHCRDDLKTEWDAIAKALCT